MLYGIIFLGFTVIITTVLFSITFIKYKKLKNVISTTISDLNKPLRYGYYIRSLNITQPGLPNKPFDTYVYVKEVDRYTNGDSKISIDKIEPIVPESDMTHDRVIKYIKDEFKSVRLTSDITWLESENEIKEMRKNKLKHLKEVME